MSAPTPNYATYSHADLLKRVTDLESQVRALTVQRQRSPSPPKKKPKKPPKSFDPARYHTRLIALKFAYLGKNYNGYEHHNKNLTPLPTIEETLWKALMKTKLIFPTFKDDQGPNDMNWDGTDYSKCGRTDKGVSAFGQVVGIRVRSCRPKTSPRADEGTEVAGAIEGMALSDNEERKGDDEQSPFDPIKDELPYVQLLNKVLPPDIRILAWCPNPPPDFSARFNCTERRYRYFFTNPAYIPSPATATSLKEGEGWLDIEAMQEAAKKYEGLHDFQNLCKVDPSKQITNFARRIFQAGIHKVSPTPGSSVVPQMLVSGVQATGHSGSPQLYYFEVRGSAFLWHQVRHLVAILFLVGQGWESPDVVDRLLDVKTIAGKPLYEMASDAPLVLWDCIFPHSDELSNVDHAVSEGKSSSSGYTDALEWLYIGDELHNLESSRPMKSVTEYGKYDRNGIMDELWVLWRQRKLDEVLAASLMDVVAQQGPSAETATTDMREDSSDRVFDGSDKARTVGTYVPLMQRARTEAPEVINARYAARKGLYGGS
nr:trna pseudouridine(38/39) synthase [Quercus suber]